MAVVTLSEMMEAGAHFGHQTRRWNPKMSRYIYCARNGVHIIDLVKTAVCMNNAYKWTRSAARSGKRFLFVGTKKQASEVVALEAARCGAAYVNQRWLGGMLTNWTTMKARIDRLKDLERMESSGAIAMRPKKEGAVLRRELERLQKYLGGLKTMRRLPDVVVLVDQRRESNAVLDLANSTSPWCRCWIPTAIRIFARFRFPATMMQSGLFNLSLVVWRMPSMKVADRKSVV